MPKLAVSDLLAIAIQNYRDNNVEKTGLLIETLADLKLSPEEELKVIEKIQELSNALTQGIEAVIREAGPKESILPGELQAHELERTG